MPARIIRSIGQFILLSFAWSQAQLSCTKRALEPFFFKTDSYLRGQLSLVCQWIVCKARQGKHKIQQIGIRSWQHGKQKKTLLQQWIRYIFHKTLTVLVITVAEPWRNPQKVVRHGLVLCVLLGLIVGICNIWVEKQTQDRLYSDVDKVPEKKVALLLGVNKRLSNGELNLYFDYRIKAAVRLYKAGKIKHLIVSGDNRTRFYNEPIEMKKALMQHGLPEQVITLDYAGFRTLDSIVRCKEVFSQNDIIIISQAFHNQRAIFISDFYSIQAIGFNADDVPIKSGVRTWVREYFARFKAVLDLYILGTQPKFLGKKVAVSV